MRYSAPVPASDHRDFNQLRRQARDLHRAFRACHPEALALVQAQYRDADPATFALSDAQLVIARLHGFESWPRLKAEVTRDRVGTLAEAVEAGDLDRVRAILQRRPELIGMDLAPDDERRALHLAVVARNAELVRLLMRAGADPHRGVYPHRDATTPLILARERSYHEIADLIQTEEARRRKRAATTPDTDEDRLFSFVQESKVDEAAELLGATPALARIANAQGATPLHVAASALSMPLVELLIRSGAAVDALDARGRTPLDCAVAAVSWRRPDTRERFSAVASYLREAGAMLTLMATVALGESDWLRAFHREQPEKLRSFPFSAFEGGLLSTAVKHLRIEMLQLLLDLGLDPDEPVQVEGLDTEMISRGHPLWHAAASGQYEMAELLLNRGADPNASAYASGTPVSQAFGVRDQRMIDLLCARGGHVDVSTVGSFRKAELAREFLAGCGPVRPRLETDPADLVRELLWAAACGGDPEIVRMCLERTDWPREDLRWFGILDQPLRFWNHGPGFWVQQGAGALDRSTYLECFRLILTRCDPNVRGRFGFCMLHEVAALGTTWGQPVMKEEERVAFARQLLDAGARLHFRDELLKSTPLSWAVRWGRLELTRLLLERGAPVHEPDAESWATPLAWAETMQRAEIAALLHKAAG